MPGYAQATRIKPWATYLHTLNDPRPCDPCSCDPQGCDPCECTSHPGDSDDYHSCACPIRLSKYDIGPGDYVRIRRLGYYAPRPGLPEERTDMIAVFSATNELLPSDQLHRVPGAIDAGVDVVTPHAEGHEPTDIPEDFAVADVVLRVPAGALYIFVAACNSLYIDNADVDSDYYVWLQRVDDLSPGDADFDGDVDLVDVADFQRCFSGTGSLLPDSTCVDCNEDGRTDLYDFACLLCAHAGPRWSSRDSCTLSNGMLTPPQKAADRSGGKVDAQNALLTTAFSGRAASASLLALDTAFLVPRNTEVYAALSAASADQGTLSFSISQPPAHGTLGIPEGTGPDTARVVYTPEANFEGVDSFAFQVSDDVHTSEPATVTLTVQKMVVPWLEVNSADDSATIYCTAGQGVEPDMTRLDYCVRGLEAWVHVTDTVIVSTQPAEIDNLYPALVNRKPSGMRIVGGIKTSLYLTQDNFTDSDGWQAIAADVARIADRTGFGAVVIDNEASLQYWARGQAPIDCEDLAQALEPVGATGVATWSWLPWIMSNDADVFPNRHDDSVELVGCMASALPANTFMTEYVSYWGWREWDGLISRRDEMFALLGETHVLEGLFVKICGYETPSRGELKRSYTPMQVLREVQGLAGNPTLRGDMIRLYTGFCDWILIARELSANLPPLAEPIRGLLPPCDGSSSILEGHIHIAGREDQE